MGDLLLKEKSLKNGQRLTIREAQAEDAGQLINHVNKVVGETDFLTMGAGEFRKTVEEEQKMILEYLSDVNALFLVAEIEATIAGVLTIKARQKARLQHAASFGISVQKEHWGKGLASSLLETMLLWANDHPVINKIMLTVHAENEQAIKLYNKYGFEEEGRMKKDFFLNGRYSDALLMSKFL